MQKKTADDVIYRFLIASSEKHQTKLREFGRRERI